MPVGAYGGRRASSWSSSRPLGPVYQAGTLSGNPVAMAAGVATLRLLLADDGAAYRRARAARRAARAGHPARLLDAAAPAGRWCGSARSCGWSLQDGEPPRRYEDDRTRARPSATPRCTRALLDRGVYLAPSAYEVMFVSLAHDEDDIDETIAAFCGGAEITSESRLQIAGCWMRIPAPTRCVSGGREQSSFNPRVGPTAPIPNSWTNLPIGVVSGGRRQSSIFNLQSSIGPPLGAA